MEVFRHKYQVIIKIIIIAKFISNVLVHISSLILLPSNCDLWANFVKKLLDLNNDEKKDDNWMWNKI